MGINFGDIGAGVNAASTFAGGWAQMTQQLNQQKSIEERWQLQFDAEKDRAAASHNLAVSAQDFNIRQYTEGKALRDLTFQTTKLQKENLEFQATHRKKVLAQTDEASKEIVAAFGLMHREKDPLKRIDLTGNIVSQVLMKYPLVEAKHFNPLIELMKIRADVYGKRLAARTANAPKSIGEIVVGGQKRQRMWSKDLGYHSMPTGIPSDEVTTILDQAYDKMMEEAENVKGVASLFTGGGINLGSFEGVDPVDLLNRSVKFMDMVDARADAGRPAAVQNARERLETVILNERGQPDKDIIDKAIRGRFGNFSTIDYQTIREKAEGDFAEAADQLVEIGGKVGGLAIVYERIRGLIEQNGPSPYTTQMLAHFDSARDMFQLTNEERAELDAKMAAIHAGLYPTAAQTLEITPMPENLQPSHDPTGGFDVRGLSSGQQFPQSKPFIPQELLRSQ